MTTPEFIPAPERALDQFGPNAISNQKNCSQMATVFFKNSVIRVRERHSRQIEVDTRLQDASAASQHEQIWTQSGQLEGKYLRFLRTREGLDNYSIIKTIGKGAFGEVRLVRKNKNGRVYALKRLLKSQMVNSGQLPFIRAERDILAESNSEWVVRLYTTFQDPVSLYMVMEFLPGGDLMTMLIKYEIFSEDITRFYTAEMIMAIAAVHKHGFIHRDIKPDNILLDSGGHVKLSDFGLSTGFRKAHDANYYKDLLQKEPSTPSSSSSSSRAQNRNSVNIDEISLTVNNRKEINDWRKSRRQMAYSAVGTPDYVAPELMGNAGYSFEIDWWSLGTIVYECLVGWPPFAAEHRDDTYRKIWNWKHTLVFPDDIKLNPHTEHLIRSLICNVENRLGRNGADEIKSHPFFAGVDFTTLRSIRAPFKPQLASDVDTTHFPVDELPQNIPVAMTPGGAEPPDRPDPEMTLPFIGYTFKRFEQMSI